MDLMSPVTLVVKAPDHKVADQTVECALGWTIKKLKRHLSAVYPSKPHEVHQKIIYSGKLLPDDIILKDVLRQFDDNQSTHTVHLVCAAGLEAKRDGFNKSTNPSSNVAGQTSVDTPPAANEGLRHRHIEPVTPVTTNVPQYNFQPGTPPFSPGAVPSMPMAYAAGMAYPGAMAYGARMTPQQMMWMQHVYNQQMMTHYMQYYPHAVYGTPPATPPAAAAAEHPANQQQQQPAPPAAPPAGVADRDPQVRMNAQGGMMMDDDDGGGVQRDWLDWIYTLCRFAILLSILYFYSTFPRFVIVVGLSVLAYLYQAGWLLIRHPRQPAQREARQQVEEPAPAPPEQAEDVNADNENNRNNDDAVQEDHQVQQPVPPPPTPGVFSVAWSVVSSFFTSLVPQQPPAINAN